ncbi:hypothetical protein BJ508DRAFT_336775, partial [Ascobolus immersus RN42]
EDYENHLKAGGIDEDWEPTSYQPQTYRPSPRTTPEPDSQYQQDSFQESRFPDPLSIPSSPVTSGGQRKGSRTPKNVDEVVEFPLDIPVDGIPKACRRLGF